MLRVSVELFSSDGSAPSTLGQCTITNIETGDEQFGDYIIEYEKQKHLIFGVDRSHFWNVVARAARKLAGPQPD